MGRATLVNGFVATAAGVCSLSTKMLLPTLRVSDTDLLKQIGGMEWWISFAFRRQRMPAHPRLGRNFWELVRELRWYWGRRCDDFRRRIPNPTSRGGLADCCCRCGQPSRFIDVLVDLKPM